MLLQHTLYKTSKEKFLYGYFLVFLVGASIGFLVRLSVGQYIIAFLDVVAILIVLWIVYDFEKRRDIEFSSLLLFWMISFFMFYYIYHLGYDITIFQLLPIPLAAAMTLSTKTYKRHSLLFAILFTLLMGYGFIHKENYPFLQNNAFVAEAFIIIMFSFAAGFVYHFTINKFNDQLQENNTLLAQSNREKTYLLKEIHHRVKNNLNMMTSILGLQEENAEDENIRIFIRQNTLRIKSIALVHELLYKETNFKDVNLHDYIDNLMHHILSISKQTHIHTHMQIDTLHLNTDDVIHVGIVVNELITNSLKYAFEQKKGTISITLKKAEEGYLLHYWDNGKGMSEETLQQGGFGLDLITLSVTHLEGEMSIDASNGFSCTILFKGTGK